VPVGGEGAGRIPTSRANRNACHRAQARKVSLNEKTDQLDTHLRCNRRKEFVISIERFISAAPIPSANFTLAVADGPRRSGRAHGRLLPPTPADADGIRQVPMKIDAGLACRRFR
jgi:hypothetical protein